MRNIFFEMRKSWLKTSTFVVLIILTILNFIRMNDFCRTAHSMTYAERGASYFRLYETVCGELTEEKLAPFRARRAELDAEIADRVYSTEFQPDKYYTGYVFGDFILYKLDIGPEITYCVTYPNKINQVAENALEAYKFYKDKGNVFETKKALMAYNLYRNRSIPEYRATYWTELFFGQDFSSLLCVILLILGLSASFSVEKESGMYQLITASGNNGKTAFAKICSAAIYSALLSAYFTICDLAFANFLLGVRGLNMPIYSASIFENSPFTFSLLGASFGISLVLIALTSLSKNVFNPLCALTPNAYTTDFSVIEFFGQPVLSLIAAVIALIAECAVLGTITFITDRFLRR